MSAEPSYIPAARWQVFSRVYDPVLAATMRERRFRRAMLERVDTALPRGGSLDLLQASAPDGTSSR